MPKDNRKNYKEKSELHPRSKHRSRYDFNKLINCSPSLKQFVAENKYGDESIDFFDPNAVKELNLAILKFNYGISNWDIPKNYLCPPIPGRADYIHYIADLLGSSCKEGRKRVPIGRSITCFDIGVGANCIYPIIGNSEYGWSFVGTEIDKTAVNSAKSIVSSNDNIRESIEIREQDNSNDMFYGVVKRDELIDVSICNPPFHASPEEARAGNRRKLSNLKNRRVTKTNLNFGGQNSELWCRGGEERFVRDMIYESRHFAKSVLWFTSLISKQSNLKETFRTLNDAGAQQVNTIEMGQGHKLSRVVAWTFQSKVEHEEWAERRWREFMDI